MKIKDLLYKGIVELKNKNIDEPVLKARMLLGFELKVKNEYLALHLEDEVEEDIENIFNEELQKIILGKPIQYITNNQSFYALDFYVDENVLIPQPDTEILVEEVIGLAKNSSKKILDMCTGSGAIAVAIAKNIFSEIFASDISEKALEIAKKNAVKNNVNIHFFRSDMFENINEKFDIIVSNPPYIETETIESLSDEVKNEPRIALDGGEDGLKFYRILASQAREYLNENGILAVEIGFNQRENVTKIFESNGFCDVYSKKDFGDNDRIVVGKWR